MKAKPELPLANSRPRRDRLAARLARERRRASWIIRHKTVIEIGAWDGAVSFECERHGTKGVLATDWFCWQGDNKLGFEIVRQALRSHVEGLELRSRTPRKSAWAA
jgi:hypothetical protein